MLTEAMIRKQVAEAAEKARQTTPLAGSITNFVTVDFVANAQLAVGGSAAMVYLPDEARSLVRLGSSFYINVGTLLPVYAESVPAAMDEAAATDKPWVLDPVALGIGTLRTELLQHARSCHPAVIRGNASEIIALADLWKLSHGGGAGVRGVDTTDTVEAAETAAIALARYTKGAVAVSGKKRLDYGRHSRSHGRRRFSFNGKSHRLRLFFRRSHCRIRSRHRSFYGRLLRHLCL